MGKMLPQEALPQFKKHFDLKMLSKAGVPARKLGQQAFTGAISQSDPPAIGATASQSDQCPIRCRVAWGKAMLWRSGDPKRPRLPLRDCLNSLRICFETLQLRFELAPDLPYSGPASASAAFWPFAETGQHVTSCVLCKPVV